MWRTKAATNIVTLAKAAAIPGTDPEGHEKTTPEFGQCRRPGEQSRQRKAESLDAADEAIAAAGGQGRNLAPAMSHRETDSGQTK